MRYSWLILVFLNLFSTNSFSVENQLSAGTKIQVRTLEPINGRVNSAGDSFKVTILKDISRKKVVIKSGSVAQVTLSNIQKPGRGQQTPRFILNLTSIAINNHSIDISTLPITEEGTPNTLQKATIDTSLPVKGYAINLAKGSILNFILQEPVQL